MQSLTSAPRRRLAAGVAGTLVAGLCAATTVASPAHAAPAVPATLTWSISQQFVEHLSTQTLTGGATFDAASKTFAFPAKGTVTAANGDVTRSYSGSVKGAFAMGGTEYYSVTLTDPAVTVEPDGDGVVTATVSAANAAAQGNAAATTAPTRVTVTEFAGAATTGAVVTATPKWAGVLPADSPAAVALGIPAGKPVEGKSFAPAFLSALTPGVRSHFYASGAASDEKKAPAPLGITGPRVAAAVTSSSYAAGVTVKVDGIGFNPTSTPADQGVYVALAPADTVINHNDRASLAALPAADWVTTARFTGDTFGTSIVASTDKLVPGKAYAVFTWQAHTHSNPSQDTVTPVAIDFSTLVAPITTQKATKPAIALKLKKPAAKRAGKVVVKIKGDKTPATGHVSATIKKGKKVVKTLSSTLNAKGRTVVKLPKAKPGKWKVVVRYTGDKANLPIRDAISYRIR